MNVAGFGFRRAAPMESLAEALAQVRQRHGPVDCLAAAESMLAAVQGLAESEGLRVIAVPDAMLADATTLTQSPRSLETRGTGSVAEAVALLAAGQNAKLLGPRVISEDRQATCAVAQGDTP
ncbi:MULTISPECIES: cobalamin biosynthesis protein [Marinobacter]|uniref:cobalamin biosynthesis protein n=1 Tax=Marinobacter TaxID=2742 RepID=UPI000DAED8F9|nr:MULTISPECIES: cobalamin biosynthesis protein [Marinobacter]